MAKRYKRELERAKIGIRKKNWANPRLKTGSPGEPPLTRKVQIHQQSFYGRNGDALTGKKVTRFSADQSKKLLFVWTPAKTQHGRKQENKQAQLSLGAGRKAELTSQWGPQNVNVSYTVAVSTQRSIDVYALKILSDLNLAFNATSI